LTGRPPFDFGTALRTLAALLTQEPVEIRKIRPEVPVELDRVILQCLAKEPANRFASVDALDLALANCGCAGWSHSQAEDWWQERRGLMAESQRSEIRNQRSEVRSSIKK
jgi:eukaryotic-like serine/threonine-protein kinase